MDCQRPYRYSALKQVVYIFLLLLTTSCAWVKDEVDDCPCGFWINLHYTYNILDVEAAPEYIKEVSLYIYDADGNYITRMDVSHQELYDKGYRIKVKGLPEGDYQFVVWSGIASSHYAIAGEKSGMDMFRLSLANQTRRSSIQLDDLYYGYLKTVHYCDEYASYDVYMMKNTNQLSCLVVPISQEKRIKADDYVMKVVSPNSTMDALNGLVPSSTMTYEPFVIDDVTVNDSEYGTLQGLKYSISTLRLMEQTDCRLILEKKDTGQQIFNVSLPEYIGMVGLLYTNMGRQLTLQEYLDRQDFYTVVFFMSNDIDELIQLQVNSWRLRTYNHLKL